MDSRISKPPSRRGDIRSIYSPTYYEDRRIPHGYHHNYFYPNSNQEAFKEDCSCTSISSEEEALEVRDEDVESGSGAKRGRKKSYKKKRCQIEKFLHRHHPLHPDPRPSREHRRFYEKEGDTPTDSYSNKPAQVPHHYIENIIVNSHRINKPQHDVKLMKKLSKCIILPDNPADPAAFTVTPGFTGTPKPPWCSSKPVIKIVGTFVILMSLGIIAAVLYVNWSSDTFRPMMK